MKRAGIDAHSSRVARTPKENGCSRASAVNKTDDVTSDMRKVDDSGKDDLSTWENSDYIFRNRKNPFNGKDCFFCESTFNLVTGPGPSFEEKIMSQIARIKSEKQDHKQADLNKPNKVDQKSSSSKVELLKDVKVNKYPEVMALPKDVKVNKYPEVMALPIDVSLAHDIDAKTKVTSKINNCQNSRQAGKINCNLVLDTSTDISQQPVKLKKSKPEKGSSELRCNQIQEEVSQHTSVLSKESVDRDSTDLSVVTNSCQNKIPLEVINCILVSDSTAIPTSTNLENLTNLNRQEPERSEQNISGAVVELLKDAEVDQHISVASLPTDVPKDQDLKDSAIVAIVENSSLNNKQPENVSSEPGLGKTPISTSISSFPKIQISSGSTYLSIFKSECEDDDTALMMEVAGNNSEAPLLDGCSPTEDSSTNYSAPSPQAVNELCLIMPSLSSDEDEDDGEFNDTQCPDGNNLHKHNMREEDLGRTAPTDNQPIPEVLGNLTSDNASISSSHLSIAKQEYGSSSDSASALLLHNNYGDLQFKSVIEASSQGIVYNNAGGMEMQNYLVCQQASQENSFDSLNPYSAHWKHTPAPALSDDDVPIFSVKETSPEPPKFFKSESINPEREKIVKLSVKLENQQISKKISEDRVAAGDVNKTQNFKQSNLTRKEHASYLKLYNKYVRFFTQAEASPVGKEKQRKEISQFEHLHRRVLNEQEEFQNYLQTIAKKNPSSFVFMNKMAKKYAMCKARSYRLKMSYAEEFSQTPQSQIPFCKDWSSVDLIFQGSILEIGVPPNIKLPDVQIGVKPVPLQYDIKKIDTCFPRYSKKTIPGYTNHETVSLDHNVKQLAGKYNFQVVMSSSAVKCLLDNHGPSFDRPWAIPVHVVELELNGKPRRVVYLDKPVFVNDLHIRDYNTLFHKYALRTFVSHPKQKHAQTARNIFQQTPRSEKPIVLDDPFDMFSSNVESLETFGAGTSLNLKKEASQASDKSEKFNISTVKHELEDPAKPSPQSCHARKLRSNMKLYKDLDEVSSGVGQPHSSNISSCHNADKPGSNSDRLPVKRKRGQDHKNMSAGQLPGTIVNKTLLMTDSESEEEPKKKDSKRGFTVRNEGSLLPKLGSALESAEADCGPHKHHLPLSVTDNQNSIKKYSSRLFIDDNLRTPIPNIPMSPVRDTPMSPVRDTPMSPVRDTPMSPVGDTPMSPVGDTPMSPSGETPTSPIWETPTSPVKEIPLSPVKIIPLSSLKETSPTAIDTAPSQAVTRSLSSGRSPNKRFNNSRAPDSSTLISQSTKRGSETPIISGGVQHTLFNPLDSILGTSSGRADERNAQNISKEDPSHYLPPAEVHSSIVYNLWSLRSINVLIRTRCHGILKGREKTRRIYVSPKMEHQTSYGLEQVTTSEVAREWASCFVRPNTNLLRARINAFTSEMMMFEELETSQILRSSLNFKPEEGFKFLDRVLQQLLSLDCGTYLLAHEYGENFCGIRSLRTGPRSEECVVPKKKMSNESKFCWIPIDPTILLPFHINGNRIPATFLPKDIKVKNIHPAGSRKNNFQQRK